MARIKLTTGVWEYDPNKPVGPAGGFGEVFQGESSLYGKTAVKRLKLSAGKAAHRELSIARSLGERDLHHVVPVLDSGQDADSDRYYVVMPLCEKSLQNEIDNERGPLPLDRALVALRAIVAGLIEVGDIVHRDLKPANVLYHDGQWKIADFGIAKFVEDSTSLDTLRSSLTPSFAAPEQWRNERPTAATDVYALGCILYSLTTGTPPFAGSLDDIRDAHLHSAPERIPTCPESLATFATLMLRKPQEARPNLQRCQKVFAEDHNEVEAVSPARLALRDAAATVAQIAAQDEAREAAHQEQQNRRNELVGDAIASLKEAVGSIGEEIMGAYEHAKYDHHGRLVFGAATFGFSREPEAVQDFWWQREDLQRYANALDWDIAAWCQIELSMKRASGNEYAWSANLIFADRKDGSGYRWYEVAFYISPLARRRKRRDQPFSIPLSETDFFAALFPAVHTVEVAYGPIPIDGESEPLFRERWIDLIAQAAKKELREPTMPVRDFG